MGFIRDQQLLTIYHIQPEMSWSIWVGYDQPMLSLKTLCNNGISSMYICKQCGNLILSQQHFGIVPSIVMLPAYRYIRISASSFFTIMVILLLLPQLERYSKWHLCKSHVSWSFSCISACLDLVISIHDGVILLYFFITIFGNPYYQCNCVGLVGLYNLFNCTI